VESYCVTATARGVRVPGEYAWAKELADEIELTRGSEAPAPCHNDLLNANFIDDGDRLRIVDWEYAGMGDRFFDLANFSINHEFGPGENELLLDAYFGAVRPADAAALSLMCFMSDFREAMWGVVQQGVSELDFDFVAYADEHFERLRRTAAEPKFREALPGSGGGGA
jgi:thiamine kinase-like enzyme